MNKDYTIPPQTRIGHVHLKVSDLEKSLEFYRDLLGFEVTMLYGNQAAFISAGGYHLYIIRQFYIQQEKTLLQFSGVFIMQNIQLLVQATMAFQKHYIWMTLMETEWNFIGIKQRNFGLQIIMAL